MVSDVISDPVTAQGSPRRRGIWFAAVAFATVGLFLISRGKWSDAIIDSGREWIVPDALSRGALLYRDVVYWFGPFTPYYQAFFFRLFGSSFSTLVLAGGIAALGTLTVLFYALRRVTGHVESAVWTSLAIPSLVFMPDAGGAILGMGYRMWHAAGFALLAVTFAVPGSERSWAAFAAGGAAGFAGLCRTEWGFAALLAGGLALRLRMPGSPLFLRAAARLLAGFLLVFGGGIGSFLLRAGPAALLRDAPVLLFNLPEETRSQVAAVHPSIWVRGAIQMTYGALTWLTAFLLLETLALSPLEPGVARRRLPRLGVLLLLIALCAAFAGFPGDVLFCGAPLLCAAACLIGLRSRGTAYGAALAGFGLLGVLTSYRRPFFIADGPYVAPPLLFALVCAGGWLSGALAKRGPEPRKRLSAWLAAAVGSLAMILFAVRALQYSWDERVPIAGTGKMLSARPETARRIENVAESIRRATSPGEGVVVFPEGELLNFLSGRTNPIRHKLYLPGYLNRENEEEILAALERARPAAVVIWPRSLSEYGPSQFGVDYATRIRAWIRSNYVERPVGGGSGQSPILAVRRCE